MDYSNLDETTLQEILNVEKNNLKIIQLQIANYGIAIPLYLQNELNRINASIKAIKIEIDRRKAKNEDIEDYLIESTSIINNLSLEVDRIFNNFIGYTNKVKSGADKNMIIGMMSKDIDTFARSIVSMNNNLRNSIRNFAHLFSQEIRKIDMDDRTRYSLSTMINNSIIAAENAISAANGLVNSLENAARQYKRFGIDAVSIDNGVDESKRMVETMTQVKKRFELLLSKIQN